jgi:hypothetical protein
MIEKYFDKLMKRMNIFLNVWRVFLTPFPNSRRKRFAGNPWVPLVSGQAGGCATETLPSFVAQPPLSVNRRPSDFSHRACPAGPGASANYMTQEGKTRKSGKMNPEKSRQGQRG